MKATRIENFVPVILTLETQEEVDKLYALSNHSVLDGAIDLEVLHSVLAPYRKIENLTALHKKLCKVIK